MSSTRHDDIRLEVMSKTGLEAPPGIQIPMRPPEEETFRTVILAAEDAPPGFGWLKRARKGVRKALGIKKPPKPSMKYRPHPGEQFMDNTVTSAKYHPLTFLPVNLFHQFKRIANLYFLVVATLQFIPNLSEVSGTTTVIPLVLVLAINAFKEGYDDYYRHVSDADINGRKTEVIRDVVGERKIEWRDIMVGDLINIKDGEDLPADLLLLASSDPEGLCFVETANLDGETNLKLKYCVKQTAQVGWEEMFEQLKGSQFHCEEPNTQLYKFQGALVGKDGQKSPLDASNLLLRGCTLRKTDWVLGLTIYTGEETRIALNQAPAPRKVTQLERHMNVLVCIMFGVQVLLAFIAAFFYVVWNDLNPTDSKHHWYLTPRKGWPEVPNMFAAFFVWWIKWVLLLNQLIPISLYVTLEVVKVLQCMLMNRDRKMYYKETDTPFNARTTTLNEELGQVQYVLSDKTGTLTQNVMGFVWNSIGGHLYGPSPPPDKASDQYVAWQTAHSHIQGLELFAGQASPPPGVPPNTPHYIAHNPAINAKLGRGVESGVPGDLPGTPVDQGVEDFMMALALCNTVTPTESPNGGGLLYQAESPDEEALVTGAAYLGFRLLSRSTEAVEVAIDGPGGGSTMKTYTVLAVLDFNSDRKRMSILLRDPESGRVRLICKGADSIILARLAKDQTAGGTRPDCKAPTLQHLDHMARGGFRTLCVAYRELSESEYRAWAAKYHEASIALHDRDAKVAVVSSEIESHMLLMGATAVEDKLQDGVPEAIQQLAQMGIKTWVLTGDKVETAICIAESCRLITPDMTVIKIREADMQHTPVQVLKQLAQEAEEANWVASKQHPSGSEISRVGVVVEGAALVPILKVDELQDAFLHLCLKCRAVVCCRVSPLQKAEVTNLVKKKAHAVTLGIGDGANDVSMIQAAHIGVGISGREGRAAVLASDFSIAQFSFLTRLLLFHGRAAYKRNREVVMYAFYKNIAYVMPYVYFGFISACSAQPLYPEMLISSYNAIWTAFPVVVFALLDHDLPKSWIVANPRLYSETRVEGRRAFYRWALLYISLGLWHSIVVFALPMLALTTANASGNQTGLMELGSAVFVAVCITTNGFLALRTNNWTVPMIVVMGLSVGLLFPFLLITSLLKPSLAGRITEEMAGAGVALLLSPRFWVSAVFLAPCLALLLDVMLIACQRQFSPMDFQKLQDYIKDLRRTATGAPHGSVNPLLSHEHVPSHEQSLRIPNFHSFASTQQPLEPKLSDPITPHDHPVQTPSHMYGTGLGLRLPYNSFDPIFDPQPSPSEGGHGPSGLTMFSSSRPMMKSKSTKTQATWSGRTNSGKSSAERTSISEMQLAEMPSHSGAKGGGFV